MATANVVKDYDWTAIPRGSSLREKAPCVYLKSYKFIKNQFLQRVKSYINITTMDADEYYEKLYSDAVTQEDIFILPYFSESVRSFTNNFADTYQNGFGGGQGLGSTVIQTIEALGGPIANIAAMVGTGALESVAEGTKLIAKGDRDAGLSKIDQGVKQILKGGGDPGSYVETPKFYQYDQNDSPIEISFVLANTINSDFDKNYNLVKRLTEINRPFRKNSIAMDPPRIFRVKIPGHRFIKWAYCSSFSVNLLGTKRNIGEKIVPEAYQINMSMQSLTVEASNFLDQV